MCREMVTKSQSCQKEEITGNILTLVLLNRFKIEIKQKAKVRNEEIREDF